MSAPHLQGRLRALSRDEKAETPKSAVICPESSPALECGRLQANPGLPGARVRPFAPLSAWDPTMDPEVLRSG